MKEKDTDRVSAGFYSAAAAMDARMRNNVNASLFSDKQKLKAEKVKLALELVYGRNSKFYMNYRKKFIAIKVVGQVKDQKNLKLFEQDWTKLGGIEKENTPQGVIYHVV
jgi:hypothetical protein